MVSVIFVSFYWFSPKKLFPLNQNFSSVFAPFKQDEKKITFWLTLSFFLNSHF